MGNGRDSDSAREFVKANYDYAFWAEWLKGSQYRRKIKIIGISDAPLWLGAPIHDYGHYVPNWPQDINHQLTIVPPEYERDIGDGSTGFGHMYIDSDKQLHCQWRVMYAAWFYPEGLFEIQAQEPEHAGIKISVNAFIKKFGRSL